MALRGHPAVFPPPGGLGGRRRRRARRRRPCACSAAATRIRCSTPSRQRPDRRAIPGWRTTTRGPPAASRACRCRSARDGAAAPRPLSAAGAAAAEPARGDRRACAGPGFRRRSRHGAALSAWRPAADGAGAARGHPAAGAINTPAILMHSGIGPARVLEQAGLSVRLDRPGVGANLQDHISVIVTARRRAPSCASCGWTASAARWCAPTWAAKVSPATCRAGGGLRAARGHGHARPAIPADGGAVHGPALAQALAAAVPGQLRRAHRPAASAQPGPHHGGGRGSAGRARIDQNFLACQEDREQVRDSVRIARDLMRQPALGDFVLDELAPGQGVEDDPALDAFIRRTAITVHHPGGTCRMGTGAIRWRWWTGACAAWACRACASSTPRSCPT